MADYIALALILTGALVLFWTQWLRTDVTSMLVTLGLILPWPHPGSGWRSILSYQDAFAGLGSPAVVMVTAMFIFGAAMVRSGCAELIGRRLFNACARYEITLQIAVLAISTLVSMFINDTTVVVIFLPILMGVCKARGLPPGRYLLWLAFGSLLGGQWTLIGTRSNIVISDYLRSETGHGFGFFDLAPTAAVVFAGCLLFILLLGRRWLPTPEESAAEATPFEREYLTEVMVVPGSSTVGKALGRIEWTRRSDLTVVEVIRGEERLPATKWLRLYPDDILIMQGPVSTIGQLLQSPDFKFKDELKLNGRTLRSVDLVSVEVLIGPRSDYAGRTLEEVSFRDDYGFTVLGISRRGAALDSRPMTTPLEFGDSLLLLGHITGLEHLQRNENLILLSQETVHPISRRKTLIVLALLAGVIGTAIAGLLNPAVSIPLVAVLALLLKCIDLESAYNSIDWQAVFTTAGMIPFGIAVEKTGAVEELSRWAVANLQGFGPITVLALLLVLALILTHFIDNSATAIILAPLAFQMATELNVNPYPFLVALAVCISASFSTPIAHESTILVMGPGRYQFKHYLKIGGVMALLTCLITVWVTPKIWPL